METVGGERVRVTDVSARDGLQNERGVVGTDAKVGLVARLAAAGFDEVEVTSFVSPRWVPQLADAEEVLAGVAGLGLESPPVFSVLVPNEKGLERALAVHGRGLDLKVSLFTAASETFSKRNVNATVAESVERFRPVVPRALDAGMAVRVYVSCAVACPFEGAVSPMAVRRVVEMVRGLAPSGRGDELEIDLGDTVGVAHPADIAALLGAFDAGDAAGMTLHLHDTHGRAAGCVEAALELGVRSFDGAVAGIGGCPYASTEGRRAPGNIDSVVLVETIERAGYRTGVDRERMAEAAAHAALVVGEARALEGSA